MKIINITDEFTNPLPPLHTDGNDRAPGVHVTQIIIDMYNELFPKDAWKVFEEMSEEEKAEAIIRFEAGFYWEDALTWVYGDRIGERLPERLHDGIYLNPDGIMKDQGIIDEYKFTWMSMNRPPDQNWKWMCQIKAYCWAYGMTKARLWVFYVNGDYSENRTPQPRIFSLEFSMPELLDNWVMLRNHAIRKGWLEE